MCADPQAAQARRHFQKLAGQAVCMMAVFCESLPEQFLSCQSISMLDGTSRMPLQAFERLKVMIQPAAIMSNVAACYIGTSQLGLHCFHARPAFIDATIGTT